MRCHITGQLLDKGGKPKGKPPTSEGLKALMAYIKAVIT